MKINAERKVYSLIRTNTWTEVRSGTQRLLSGPMLGTLRRATIRVWGDLSGSVK